MTLGNEDVTLEVSEIVRNTVSHISFDGDGNVSLNSNNIDDVKSVSGQNGTFDFTASHNVFSSKVSGADIRFFDTGSSDILRLEEDTNNVKIPNGDLVDGSGNVIYDQSSNSIPSARVDISNIDADTVDGFEASELRASSNVAQLTSTNTTLDINQSSWTDIPFDVQQILDSSFSHDASSSPETITFDESGKYRVYVSLSFDSTGASRVNPAIKFNINGTRLDTTGASGYIRHADGHDEASNSVARIVDVNAGDTLKVQTLEFGDSGEVLLRANESVLTIEQLSASSAPISDADTLDGLDSTAFVKTDGSTPITSAQAITQAEGSDYLKFTNTTTGDTWDFTVEADASLDLDVNNSTVLTADSASQQVTFPSRVTGLSGFDAGSSSIDNVSELNTIGSGSASFTVYDSANGQDIAIFEEGGTVDIPNGDMTIGGGSLSVADNAGVEFGADTDFSVFYDNNTDELVVRDDENNIELIRQPKSGATEFIQGADIGPIEAPEDSLTQIINAANTSATSSGDTIGYTFALDNQSLLSIESTSDGSGGLSDKWVELQDDLRALGGETIWDESNSYIPQGRLQNDSLTVAGNSVSLGGSTGISHNNISGISSNDHHTRYTDGEAASAAPVQSVNGFTGSVTLSASDVGAASDNHGNESHSANFFLSSDYNPEADTHSRYNDFEARDAIEAGDVDRVKFSNIEDVNDGEIGRDNSIGFLGSWGGNGTAVLWDAYNVNAGNAINILNGKGNESNPEIAVNESGISHDNISGVSSGDHHTRYSDSEAASAAPVQSVNSFTGSVTLSASDVGAASDNHGNESHSANFFLSSDYNPEADTHSRYNDFEARDAIEAGDVDRVKFSNIEDVNDGEIGRDNSIGFLGSWGGNGTAVLWDAYNVNAGNAINILNGKGNESNPEIAVNESGISHDNISGISSGDHHTRYSDSEASSAAPVQSVNGEVGSVTVTTSLPAKSQDFPTPGERGVEFIRTGSGGQQLYSDSPNASRPRIALGEGGYVVCDNDGVKKYDFLNNLEWSVSTSQSPPVYPVISQGVVGVVDLDTIKFFDTETGSPVGQLDTDPFPDNAAFPNPSEQSRSDGVAYFRGDGDFRGDGGFTGVSLSGNIVTTFSEGSPRGVTADGEVLFYGTSADFTLRAFDLSTTTEIWSADVGVDGLQVDDEAVYSLGSSGVAAVTKYGDVIWGPSGSATNISDQTALDGSSIYWDIADGVGSKNKHTGAQRWSNSLPDSVNSISAKNGVVGVAADTGKIYLYAGEEAKFVSDGSKWYANGFVN
jgi:hypothetical protein